MDRTENFINKAREVHGDRYDYSKTQYGKDNKENVTIVCKTHGDFLQSPNTHLRNHGCKKCNQTGFKTIDDSNSFPVNNPELKKYFKFESDYHSHSIKSAKMVWLRCPDCGTEKLGAVSNLTGYGFKCLVCGDGISLPEKFLGSVLNQIGMHWIPQKTFDWSQKRIYDFYIPSLNMIIETHGMQHYKDLKGVFKGKGIEEQVRIDLFKKEMAVENGISKYVEIDMRYSDFDHVKKQVEMFVNNYFHEASVDYEKAWFDSNKSFVVKSWELWESGSTILQIAETINRHYSTIYRYLKQGSKCGKCSYSSNTEKARGRQSASLESSKKLSKAVLQYTKEGKFVSSYSSGREAERQTGIRQATISSCCREERKFAGGFIWKFKNDSQEGTLL